MSRGAIPISIVVSQVPFPPCFDQEISARYDFPSRRGEVILYLPRRFRFVAILLLAVKLQYCGEAKVSWSFDLET